MTDRRMPGNPTRSYRTREPVRVLGELLDWTGHSSEQIAAMQAALDRLRRDGKAEIFD